MEIRQAITTDAPQLELLGPRVCANAVAGFRVPFSPASWAEQVRALLEFADRRVFVAVTRGNRVAGMHAVVAAPLLFNTRALVVRTATLWVDPDCRGQGVAGGLHALAEEWARSIGARAMVAGVPHDYRAHADLGDEAATPAAAAGFYSERGYRPAEASLVMEVR